MPTSEQILTGLQGTANEWRWLAVFWHVYFAALLISLLRGARLSKPSVGALLSLPLFSVSLLAWTTGNPVNGSIFAVLGIALGATAFTLPTEPVQLGGSRVLYAGLAMVLFGWFYPHFLETSSFIPYLYAAPTGLVPCPTLSMVIGLSLILDGLGSRKWQLVLGAAGLFYGLFGAFRLDVAIDLALPLGALLIVLLAILPKHETHQPAPAH
jgi:hypothetical protein